MALLNFDEQNQLVTKGSRYDACIVCADKLAKEEKISIPHALSRLGGKLEGKTIVKITYGRQFCLCPDCLAEFNKEVNPVKEQEEPAVKEERPVVPKGPESVTDSPRKRGNSNEKAKTTK